MLTPPFLYPWPQPLVEGRLLRRYQRFLADITLPSGETVTAHCVNPGRMEGMVRPGARVWLSPARGATRKLAWTWEIVELEGRLVGANTVLPNRLVANMLEARVLEGFTQHQGAKAEQRYDVASRIDFLLAMDGREHLLEVKNCHLVYPDNNAYFPDSVSQRATEHLRALGRAVESGRDATVLFVVQRADAERVRPSDAHDPTFAAAAREAAMRGVRFRAIAVEPRIEGIMLMGSRPVDLTPYAIEPILVWREALRAFGGWEAAKTRTKRT